MEGLAEVTGMDIRSGSPHFIGFFFAVITPTIVVGGTTVVLVR